MDELSALKKQLVDDLTQLVTIESISSIPAHRQDLANSAQLVAEMWTATGCPDVHIVSDVCAPAVVAHFPGPPGSPHLCFYAHHDVQPSGDHQQWDHPPFQLTTSGERLYGRGSADDKGAIAVHLATMRAFNSRPPMSVTFLIEGEEEIGSPNIGRFLTKYSHLVNADGFVILDSGNEEVGEPAFTTTLRGVCDAIIEVQTLDHGVHSGQFGGVYPDALTTLCRLLATFHDDQGEVAIAGLDSVVSFDVNVDREQLRTAAGVLDSVQELGSGSLADRLWAGPAVTVIGLDTVSVEEASNTLLPVARAKVSVRVPPGMSAERALDALIAHCEQHIQWGARLRITRGAVGNPAQVDLEGSLVQAGRRAYQQAFGKDPVFIGQGGAIPLVNELREFFPDGQFLITAIADPNSSMHGPNESVSLDDLTSSVAAQVALIEEFSRGT
ncbi:MAG: M20/M25/M40 family metallo-hydrolase [Propionibacteriaceae bacterium]|nr:M20/M25/M40 family metallo-hydrolase [Propionibacteriaceae bacterium]